MIEEIKNILSRTTWFELILGTIGAFCIFSTPFILLLLAHGFGG